MKTLTKNLMMTIAMTMAVMFANAQQQIPFEGYNSQGQGFASWNADGSGPEPAATGHINPLTGTPSTYYAASLDYISQNTEDAGFHLLPEMTGFADFELSLSSNGYTPEDVKVKLGLGSYEEDIEGLDWLTLGEKYYANHYTIEVSLELDGQAMLSGNLSYINHQRTGTENYWYLNSSFTNLTDVSVGGVVAEITAAFLNDLDGKELIFYAEMNVAQTILSLGRSGYSFNLLNGMLTTGNPTLPFKGLKAENEGTAGWDADGTGPEPAANGHWNMVYYAASVDYDGINSNPDACLAHCLEGSEGFLNTMLQLQYRGFEAGDIKIKMGLCSFGPDVLDEDWGFENGIEWTNEYNNNFTIEINGEPILEVLCDTNKMTYYNPDWSTKTSVGKVYNISENTSLEAQFIALSFLRDFGNHYLKMSISTLSYAGAFAGNGRSGVYYEIVEGEMLGVYEQATFIPEGPVSGTWAAENSPYYIDGHLSVENGETLTIEPGVKVAVRGPYHFDVQGCVKAEGTADENIIFTRSNPNLWWDGFDFNNTPAENDTSKFDHCILEYGYAQGTIPKFNGGGAIGILNFDKVGIYNSIFRHNKADITGSYSPSGGAIAFEKSDLTIQRCVFYDNYSEYGGAIFVYNNTNPVISNSLFYQNTSDHGGALCYYEHCSGVLINNTISDNSAVYGGAVYFFQGSNPEIINTIIWGNEASLSGNQVYSSNLTSSPDFYYCDIEDGQAGFGGSQINGNYLFNIEDDPEFETAPEFPPYLISTTSPCINQGTPDTSAWYYLQYLPETCLCGNPRVCNGRIEMGAYERLISHTEDIEIANNKLQIFPNPFVENLTINFELENTAMAIIEIYNVVGEKVDVVSNTTMPAGKHCLNWNSPSQPEGIYFCRMQIGNEVFTQKIVKQ